MLRHPTHTIWGLRELRYTAAPFLEVRQGKTLAGIMQLESVADAKWVQQRQSLQTRESNVM